MWGTNIISRYQKVTIDIVTPVKLHMVCGMRLISYCYSSIFRHSRLHDTLTIPHICGWPNFIVLIYLHTTTTTMLVIRHFSRPNLMYVRGDQYAVTEGPHFFQGPYVISTLEHARERWGMLWACFFDTNVLSYLCIFTMHINRHSSLKNAIFLKTLKAWHLRPNFHITKYMAFR